MSSQSLEAELERARELSVSELTDAIESIGFECTRCGACCTRDDGRGCGTDADEPNSEGSGTDDEGVQVAADDPAGDDPAGDDSAGDDHTATLFPDEARHLLDRDDASEWRDVARPMPYGLRERDDGSLEGETFEWALQTDACGDCVFYDEAPDGTGACVAHEDRPLICRTYPFSVALAGTSQPMGEAVDEAGIVRAHECEGLGRDISREDAEALARSLKERAVRELEEAIDVRDAYEPADPGPGEIVVHDSEGAKREDGTLLDGD